MFEVKVSGSKEWQDELEELVDRASNLSPTNNAVREAVVRQNERVNFDPEHENSILDVSDGDGAIGSKFSSYTKLLKVDEEEIADILEEHILGGGRG